ncbi:MAG TPA: hypothetical protein VF556_12115 [Pyrinomonadaceae bacterium]|jgi:hypothetical protein
MDESISEYKEITDKLSPIVEVIPTVVDSYLAFSLAFAQMFRGDIPNYRLKDGTIGATRSNWTYHTAFAIAQTAKMFNMNCKFECHGKRDAVIETRENNPQIALFAEWEWDYEDIFGKGKELDKLKTSCKDSYTAEAFLLVYCPKQKYPDYLFRVTEFWANAFKKSKYPPSLFLHTIIFEDMKIYREFKQLITVIIHPEYLRIISDISFEN